MKSTRETIKARLEKIIGAYMEWTGRMPADTEKWNQSAAIRASELDVEDIEEILEHGNMMAETDEEMLDMAISQAAEPEDLPENGCVVVAYSK